MLGTLLSDVRRAAARRRGPSQARPAWLCLILAILAVACIAGHAWATNDREVASTMMGSTDAPPRKVVIGTMMYAMWEEYPGLDARLATLSGFVDRMAAEAQRRYHAGLDLAVLPENAVTGGMTGDAAHQCLPLQGAVLEAMGAAARKHHAYIVVAMGLVDDAPKGLYSNAAVLLDRQGKVMGIYRKVHLVAGIGESNLEGGFTGGRKFPVFQCDFGRVGLQICFDMEFDDGWEALARKGAEIIAWPSQSPQTVAPRARARAGGCYVVSSTWRNNASIFDPVGDLIAQTTEPSSVLVEQVDLSYAIIGWQPNLRNGAALAERYGRAVGYRYSEAEDRGIFWSNDPSVPIMRMVRDLDLELMSDCLARNLKLQDELRGGPPERD